jgi:hypothetical protein
VHDEIRQAYATLGLDPRAAPREVRRQFKRLVRQWHPDRYTQDPQGQAEAARRMRQINEAYQLVCAASVTPVVHAPSSPAEPTVEPTPPRERVARRLGRSAIDGIVRSIGTESPLDAVFDFFAWSWPLFVAFLISEPRHRWSDDDPQSSGGVWQGALIVLAVFLWFWRRRRGRDRP